MALLIGLTLAYLVTKGYTYIYDVNYHGTFSSVAKVASVNLFLSLVVVFY